MSLSFAVSPSLRSAEIPNPLGRRFLVPRRTYQHGSKCRMLRRNFALKGIIAAGVSVAGSSFSNDPVQGMERLPFKPEGYNFWTWRGHKIHYVEQGEGFPIVLIHGFGASAFHWRYNIPELAKKYKVYAIDLLGFGWSEKAIIEYDAMVWKDQVLDFLKEIVKEPAVLVGNSLGGFTALVTAADLSEEVIGVALLNSAGQFSNASRETDTNSEESYLQKYLLKPLKEVFQRIVLGFLFWQAKQPARIKSVLKSVYINTSNVDDYLVESITTPAADPNAGEVYYRYGLVWISTTLVFVIASLGNCATYLIHKRNDNSTSWSFDVGYVILAACAVYGYALLVPVAFYFLLRYSGANASLLRLWCMWGYSLFIFILSSFQILLVIPVEILRWIIIILTGVASACFVSLNIKTYVEGNYLTVGVVASFVLQIALALFIKILFFP